MNFTLSSSRSWRQAKLDQEPVSYISQRGRAATKNSGTGIHHRGAEYTEKCFSLKTIRTQRPPRLRGGFSISSQLANNFDYSSAEFGVFLTKILLLGVLRASALKVVADPSFGGSAVSFPSTVSFGR